MCRLLVPFACAFVLVGCGSRGVPLAPPRQQQPPGITPSADSSLAFHPANILFERLPSACGATNPPFAASDTYYVQMFGAGAMPTSASINLQFPASVAVGQDLAITLSPFGVISMSIDASGATTNHIGQDGQRDNFAITFLWMQGANPKEVDAGPLSSVTLRVVQLPQYEGDLGIVHLDMHFTDGGVLDFDVAEPVMTLVLGCPRG
jgi:hypothetical protein